MHLGLLARCQCCGFLVLLQTAESHDVCHLVANGVHWFGKEEGVIELQIFRMKIKLLF